MLKRASRSRALLLAVATLVALVSTAGVVLIDSHTSTNLGEALAGVAAVNAVLGALGAVLQNRVMRREDVADQYAERMNDPKMIEYNALISAFLRLDVPLDALDVSEWAERDPRERESVTRAWNEKPRIDRREEKLAHWNAASQKERGELTLYSNLFEEIALMHRLRRLDRDIVDFQFAGAVRAYYTFARWFIAAIRHTGSGYNRRAYNEWEALVQRLAGGIHLDSEDREPLGVATDPSHLLDSIVGVIDRRAILYLEGVTDPDLKELLEGHVRMKWPKVCKGDLDTAPGRDFRIPLGGGVTDQLREWTSDPAKPPAFGHLLVYRRWRVLLEAYDAGDGWVYASRKRVAKPDRAELIKRLAAKTDDVV